MFYLFFLFSFHIFAKKSYLYEPSLFDTVNQAPTILKSRGKPVSVDSFVYLKILFKHGEDFNLKVEEENGQVLDLSYMKSKELGAFFQSNSRQPFKVFYIHSNGRRSLMKNQEVFPYLVQEIEDVLNHPQMIRKKNHDGYYSTHPQTTLRVYTKRGADGNFYLATAYKLRNWETKEERQQEAIHPAFARPA